jgi:nitrogen-specific signal transduction histidine kinase
MKGTAEILLDFVPEEATERKLATAHLAEIDRLSSVLSRFLDFARHRLPDVQPVRLGDVLDRVDELLRAQASQQETTLTVRHQAVTVQADFDQLVQVVLAIAINALQAVEQDGTVRLDAGTATREDGEWGVITVRNDGPPIPEEIRTLLFDPFVSTREDGTGLGLANAWRIVSDHNGNIEAENVGGWVEFRVLLPR